MLFKEVSRVEGLARRGIDSNRDHGKVAPRVDVSDEGEVKPARRAPLRSRAWLYPRAPPRARPYIPMHLINSGSTSTESAGPRQRLSLRLDSVNASSAVSLRTAQSAKADFQSSAEQAQLLARM